MKTKIAAVLTAATMLAGGAFAATATTSKSTTTTTSSKSTASSSAKQQPKITMAEARAAALKKAPGKVKSEELENEKGKLIYSFDIETSKTSITEVNVDAMTGKIVDVQHETPAKEAQEKKDEAKAKKH